MSINQIPSLVALSKLSSVSATTLPLGVLWPRRKGAKKTTKTSAISKNLITIEERIAPRMNAAVRSFPFSEAG